MAIGYPKEWPNALGELSKWGDNVILRLHVDVCTLQGKLVSQPHVEPDPEYNAKEHLDMWRKKNACFASSFLTLLRFVFNSVGSDCWRLAEKERVEAVEEPFAPLVALQFNDCELTVSADVFKGFSKFRSVRVDDHDYANLVV